MRDLTGYGLQRPTITWPNGAKVALSLVVNYEEGAEAAIGDDSGAHETRGELASDVPLSMPDLAIEQMFNYGTRAGLPRLLELFSRHRMPTTFFMCGRAAERTPELARKVAELGHEIACHGYRWISYAEVTALEEKADLERAVEALTAVTGVRPLGFYSRWGASTRTRENLLKLGFVYDSNSYDDDLPFYDFSHGAPVLIVPYALDTNDYKFFSGDPWGTANAFLDYLKTALDVLLEEGDRGQTSSILNVGLHLRIIGRPARFAGLSKFVQHVASLGDRVWVARRIDIARHWLATCPPTQARHS
ncbi:MAG: polysaccharide deacetylase family protein [Reyranellaceae bacterium]